MMRSSDDAFRQAIALPITQGARQTAESFAQEQPTADKTAQVYRNTLAVSVVNDYLQMLGIATDLAGSYSWNPVGRLCSNAADLKLSGAGRLECLPLPDGADHCAVAPEVWSNRLGYVVVQLDENAWEGRLLGFVPRVRDEGTIAVHQLRSLEEFLAYLDEIITTPVDLRRWGRSIYTGGWMIVGDPRLAEVLPSLAFRMGQVRAIEEYPIERLRLWVEQLYQSQPTPQAAEIPATLRNDPVQALLHLLEITEDEEIRWRAAEMLWPLVPDDPRMGVKGVLDLGFQFQQDPIALMVAVLPRYSGSRSILTRVYPLGSQAHLPANLQLSLLDEAASPLLEIASRVRDNYIQLKFVADPGETFGIGLGLGEVRFTQTFIA